jgi:antitoxin ParD1/3/4
MQGWGWTCGGVTGGGKTFRDWQSLIICLHRQTEGFAMNVNLTPELENMVRQSVVAGLYNNASEVMREALRCWLDMRGRQDLARAEAARGFEQLEKGLSAPLDMSRAKKNAIANAKAGRKVSPLG